MTSVTYHNAPNRLGQKLFAIGGKSVSAALADAEANLHDLRANLVAEVDTCLQSLREAADHAAAEGASESVRATVYTCAVAIAGLGGLCGMPRLGEVAYNLCDLTDRYIDQKTWNAAAVTAHLDTLTLLRQGGIDQDGLDGKTILDALKELVRRAEGAAQADRAA